MSSPTRTLIGFTTAPAVRQSNEARSHAAHALAGTGGAGAAAAVGALHLDAASPVTKLKFPPPPRLHLRVLTPHSSNSIAHPSGNVVADAAAIAATGASEWSTAGDSASARAADTTTMFIAATVAATGADATGGAAASHPRPRPRAITSTCGRGGGPHYESHGFIRAEAFALALGQARALGLSWTTPTTSTSSGGDGGRATSTWAPVLVREVTSAQYRPALMQHWSSM